MQKSAGSILSQNSTLLSMIVNDQEKPLDRKLFMKYLFNSIKLSADLYYLLTVARRTFLLGFFDENFQKVLKKVDPTKYIFGDDFKTVYQNFKSIEKISKEEARAKAQHKTPLRQLNQPLNFKSSASNQEVGRKNYRRSNTSRKPVIPDYKSHPAKKSYHQTQPH